MSSSFKLNPFISPPKTHQSFFISHPKTHQRLSFSRPKKPQNLSLPKLTTFPTIRSVHENSEHLASSSEKPRWENVLSTAASLYPLYITFGGVLACLKPSSFAWFVKTGPTSYSLSLGLIMLAMGITLELKDLISLFRKRPFSILFGCLAQYTIMPAFGAIISRILGLSPSLSVGLILLSCCPGGTASNVARPFSD